MVETAERQLAELIESEQRGLRSMLRAGFFVMMVLGIILTGIGVFSFNVWQDLSKASFEAKRTNFEMRVGKDQQNVRIAQQDERIRSAISDIRKMAEKGVAEITPQKQAEVLADLKRYLETGDVPPITSEVLVRPIADKEAGSPVGLYLSGVAGLFELRNSGQSVSQASARAKLEDAVAQLTAAAGTQDPEIAPMALTAIAYVKSQEAVSSNYTPKACQGLFQAVANAEAAQANGLPLWQWRADCERKLGRTRDSFLHFAALLARIDTERQGHNDARTNESTINALHGAGTTLIGLDAAKPADAPFQNALAATRKACGGSPALSNADLALKCLDLTLQKRAEAAQSTYSQYGTAENKGFAFLRTKNYEAALTNSREIAKESPLAWNELVRAIAAAHVADSADGPAASAAEKDGVEARQNLQFFSLKQFGTCELRTLMPPDLINEAVALLAKAHPGEAIPCFPKG